MFELRPAHKPSHKRFKQTAKERGRITPEVYEAALERSGSCCERCGKYGNPEYQTLQCAHLVRRWKLKTTTVNDVAMLCGPSVNTGTCHNWIDFTAAGKEWALEYREQLYEKAKESEG